LVPGDTNGAADVFVRDLVRGTTARVSVGPGGAQGDGGSGGAAISADGRFVAFPSEATNLVSGDTNGASDVFLRDRRTGVTRRPSVGQGGVQGNDLSHSPALSADGRYVAFGSDASNLVPGDTNGAHDVFVRTRR
jgi:Tol biopolymer transport system component